MRGTSVDTPPLLCYTYLNNRVQWRRGKHNMTKPQIKSISLIIQGIYSVFCLFEIILCLVYRGSHDTEIGSVCAEMALHLIFFLFLFLLFAMPISFTLNILARPHKEDSRSRCVGWLSWIIVSPILYIILWTISLGVWISITGGIWYNRHLFYQLTPINKAIFTLFSGRNRFFFLFWLQVYFFCKNRLFLLLFSKHSKKQKPFCSYIIDKAHGMLYNLYVYIW